MRPKLNDGTKLIEPTSQEIADKQANAKIVHTGFVAQEVEAVAKNLKYDFSGVDKPKNGNDFYGLRYAEFVVPIVKAVQELSKKNDEKEKKIGDQQNQILDLQNQINEIKTLLSAKENSTSTVSSLSAYLKQNVPNPYNNGTVINYYVPGNAGNAQIKITDSKGSVVKIFTATKGNGQLNIKSGELAAGTYNYTLYVNNKSIDTKQMVIIK